MPDALVISEPVGVPTEINTRYRLADYTAASDPETERIKLDAYSCIDVKRANQPPGG